VSLSIPSPSPPPNNSYGIFWRLVAPKRRNLSDISPTPPQIFTRGSNISKFCLGWPLRRCSFRMYIAMQLQSKTHNGSANEPLSKFGLGRFPQLWELGATKLLLGTGAGKMCWILKSAQRPHPAPKVYQRLCHRLILKPRLRYSDHPSPNFYRGEGENVRKLTKWSTTESLSTESDTWSITNVQGQVVKSQSRSVVWSPNYYSILVNRGRWI